MIEGAQRTITATVTEWEGVVSAPHHLLPHTGWVSFWIRTDEDVPRAIDLLATSYELALEQRRRRAERERTTSPA